MRQTAPEPTYELGVVRELVTVVHAAGRRIAAHVTTALVGELVRLGIDSVEHGTSLDEPTLAEMAQRGTAWIPTLCAVLASPPDATDERRRSVAERHARMKDLLPLAIRLGIPVLTGSDVVGFDPAEVELLVECVSVRSTPCGQRRRRPRISWREIVQRRQPLSSHITWIPARIPLVLGKPAAIVIGGVRVR